MNARRRPWRPHYSPHWIATIDRIACVKGEGRRKAEADARKEKT